MTDKPLRILHYVPGVNLEQGGVVRAILDWCTVFANHGHEVSLAVYQGENLPPDWSNQTPGKPRATVVPAPMPPLKLLSRTAMRMIGEQLSRIDVLHLHGPWLDGNRQIAKLARKLGVPYIVSLHGMLDDWAMAQRPIKKRMYMSLAGRRVLDRADRLHCTAAGELAQAGKWFSNPRTVVLPPIVDLSPFEQLPGSDMALQLLPAHLRGEKKLLFLSRLHEQKGVDVLIRAAAVLMQRSIPFVLLLAGTGTPAYQQFLHGLVDQLNLREKVVFPGHLNGIQKISAFAVADLFVLPTRHENFGLAMVEAMACGIPVLTTRGTDIWQEIQNAGGVISDLDPAALADHIIKLLGDPADRIDRGKRGREWAFGSLATATLVRKYEDLYREVISDRQS